MHDSQQDPKAPDSGSQFIRTDLPWYKQSYVLLLISALVAGAGFLLPAVLFLIWGLLNLRNDKWYRFLWAWVILTPVLLASFARVMFV